eukprot:1155458-Pelagomonas_calceolata.AAC.2
MERQPAGGAPKSPDATHCGEANMALQRDGVRAKNRWLIRHRHATLIYPAGSAAFTCIHYSDYN